MILAVPRTMPWKNGGGVTHELWREPAEPADFNLRISMAEVAADGPFSRFPGVDRHLALVRGGGFRIVGPAGEHVVTEVGAPIAFPGEDPWDCTLLAGSLRDFNVMVRRATGLLATVRRVGTGPLPAGARFVFALVDGVAVGPAGAEAPVPREHLAILEAPDTGLVAPAGGALVVSVS